MADYNPMSDQFTDEEVIAQFGLDPALAGTPKLNEVLREKMYNENISAMMDEGMSLDKARAKAGMMRAKAKHESIKDLKKRGLM